MGVVLILQGKIDLAGHGEPTTAIWVASGLAMVSGLLLLAGFLTPIAAAIGGLRAMSAVVSLAPAAGLSLFISKPSSAFLAAITAGIVILGPGSFSVDSRLFGLREVIIPILRVPRRGRDSDH